MKEKASDAKPCDYFDMIAGSETGGFVSLVYTEFPASLIFYRLVALMLGGSMLLLISLLF